VAGPEGSSPASTVTIEQLELDPHPLLAELRALEPVAWIPALDGWLVTRYDLVLEAMRNPHNFTVDDPRFSTGRIVGPSMLSLDGEDHARHRAPFVAPFRVGAVRDRFEGAVEREADALIDGLLEGPPGGEMRRAFAGPLAAATVVRALGLGHDEVDAVLAWYDAIVGAVTKITAGAGVDARGRAAFADLRARLLEVIETQDGDESLLAAAADSSTLTREQIVANAAILLFGGIETTEGMIANAVLMVLSDPEAATAVRADPGLIEAAVEESLRLEPAAAVIDRYATADVSLGGTAVRRGDLVRLSLAGANRDPAVFDNPDRFDLQRRGLRRHLAFAQGPHVCAGVHLARIEARVALRKLLDRLPGLRLDVERPAAISGLVFRKPLALHMIWGGQVRDDARQAVTT
jgi:cytochrome P450